MSKVKSKYIDFGTGTNQVCAGSIPLDVTNLNNNLSSSDTDLQKALETLDNLVISAGSGDVVGPSSAVVDNAIVRFDTTTGKLIQGSGAYIDDNSRLGIGISTPIAGLDVEILNNGTTAKFGATGGCLYVINTTNSGLGFNTYYDSSVPSWKFGKNSSSMYAGAYIFVQSTGDHRWYCSSATGNATANATLSQLMQLSSVGVLNVVGGITINGSPVGGSSSLATLHPFLLLGS